MKSSKFNVAALNLVAVATGVKASNDVAPTLTVQGLPNKFQLNRLATVAMGLKTGDRVRIFNNKNAENINEKFFIAKVAENDATGAKVNRSNSTTKQTEGIDMAFNYSGVWSVCLQGDPSAAELGFEALEAKGLVISGKTSGGQARHRATLDIKFLVEEVGAMDIDGVTLEMFALTGYTASAKTEEDVKAAVNAPESDEDELDLDEEVEA
jgi:hypothetical protein